MKQYIKKGMEQGAVQQAGKAVQTTVQEMIADIEERGQQAVREYSKKLDNWGPETFRLSKSEIDECIWNRMRRFKISCNNTITDDQM